jgi:hypothetical protein
MRASGPFNLSPISKGQYRVIGQKRYPGVIPYQYCRPPRFRDISPHADGLHSIFLYRMDGIEKGLSAEIHTVVAGERDHMKAAISDSASGIWMGPHGKSCLRQRGSSDREVGFQLTELDIALFQHAGYMPKNGLRILAIRPYVTDGIEHNFLVFDVCH